MRYSPAMHKRDWRLYTPPRWLLPALSVMVPMALYSWFLIHAPSRWPQWWFPTLVLALASFITASSVWKREFFPFPKEFFVLPALFLSGLLMAGVIDLTGFRWLHIAYVPYVLVAGVVFRPLRLLLATLFVPLFEALHLHGGPLPEELALVAATSLASALLFAEKRKKKMRPEDARGDAADAPDYGGLEGEKDTELRGLLRAVCHSLRPDAVSLFLITDGELELRSSTDGETRLSTPGTVQDVVRFRHSIFSNDLESVHAGPGYRRAGTVRSAVASPVLLGSFVLGVLAMDSGREDAFGPDAVTALELFASQVARVLERRRIDAETGNHMEWLNVIHEESSRLLTSLESGTIIRNAGEAMQKIAPVNIHFFLKAGKGYDLVYQNGLVPGKRISFSLRGTLTEMALKEKEPKYFSNLKGYSMPVLPFDDGVVASALMLPLVYRDEPLGAIVFCSEEPDSLGPRQIDYLAVLGNQASISLKNAIYHAEIQRKAVTDGLTGLYNHKHFREELEAEIKRSGRSLKPFSILLIDIDFFKKINDTYGHQAGDEVLKGTAAVIKQTLREVDIPGRYGGEEFAAILIDTDLRGAVTMAERLRQNILGSGFQADGTTINITVSIGVASYPDDGESVQRLVEHADQALYRAKAGGRNRTISYGTMSDTRL